MSERPLEVGEIGGLQNFIRDVWLNGSLAEGLSGLGPQKGSNYKGPWEGDGYLVKVFCKQFTIPPNGTGWIIEPHQIRRTTDPDQQKTTEHDEVISV